MNLSAYQDPKVIRKALSRPNVAIVGLSSNELRASNFVGRYLLRNGYRIFPVNPREEEILGCKSWPTLQAIPENIDTVDVFRHPSAVPEVATAAIEISASCLWLQYGVIDPDCIDIAVDGGLDVVADCCMKVEHARYRGRMHWLGFNTGRISARRGGF